MDRDFASLRRAAPRTEAERLIDTLRHVRLVRGATGRPRPSPAPPGRAGRPAGIYIEGRGGPVLFAGA